MLLLQFPPSTWIWGAVLIAVGAAALWRGGPPEKAGAGAIFTCWLATLVVYDRANNGPQWGILVVDAILLAILLAIALRADRFWPLFAAGCHLLAVVTHAARIVDPSLVRWTYITAEIIWGYLVVAALAWGVWSQWRLKRRAQPAANAAPSAAPGATRR